jgi:hypothetical protein
MIEENTKMEDHLSEEQLDRVTGGTGHVADCPSCNVRLHIVNRVKGYQEHHESLLDAAAIQGDAAAQNEHKKQADLFYKEALKQYEKIIAHGHSDFPGA